MKPLLDPEARLVELTNQFASLRRNGAPAKIPVQLRREVIELLDSGASQKQLIRALGLTRPQICTWRRKLAQKVASAPVTELPRILNVIPSEPTAPAMPSGLRVSYEAGRLLLEFSF